MEPDTKPEDISHAEMVKLLQENHALIQDTNTRIRNLQQRANISLVLKIFWIAFLLLIPFIVFNMVSDAFGTAVDTAGQSIDQFSATKSQLEEVIKLYKGE